MTTLNYNRTPVVVSPVFSIPSILAICAAIGSFFVSPGLTMLLAIAALVLGAIGFIIALTPSRRGGIISIASMVIGALAFLIAIIRFIA